MRELSLTFEQIQSAPLLRGELFWCRPSGRRLCIGHAGEFANIDLISKLSKTNDKFSQSILIDEERVSKVVDHFMDLKKAMVEDIKLRYRNLILLDFYRVLRGEAKASGLDFVFICHEVFYELNASGLDLEDEFIKKDAITFKRAQVVASSLVYLAMVTGYLDFSFLKEVFNTVLMAYFSHTCRQGEGIVDEVGKIETESYYTRNQAYIRNLAEGFFDLEYNLSDDISAIWHKLHSKVFSLELNFGTNDIDCIFNEVLKDVKEYRYLNEIFSQEDIGRSA